MNLKKPTLIGRGCQPPAPLDPLQKLLINFICFLIFQFLYSPGLQSASLPNNEHNPYETKGCTTILVGKKATADNSVIMGHNEDMGDLSGRLLFQPAQTHQEKEIKVNYVTIPQVSKTYHYWASGNSTPVADKHYDGGWILCGMNQNGVSFGCNTMSTREKPIPRGKGILRYSIRQLILERSKTAQDAVKLIGHLVDKYGQSDSPVAYCIADQNEAWLVETTYRHWVTQRIPDDGFHVETNEYSIETHWDSASDNLLEYAIQQGWHDPEKGPFNFKYAYGNPKHLDQPRNTSRRFQGSVMLKHKIGSVSVKDILYILSQPPIQTTTTQAFMVWHLRSNMPPEIGCVMWHGMSGANTGIAIPLYVGSSKVPEEYTNAAYTEDSESAWWHFERLQKQLYPRWWEYSPAYFDVRKKLNKFQELVFKENVVVEEKAILLWKSGDTRKAKERLTTHTYKMLEQALKTIWIF
jgi:dipeptidase